MMDEAKRRGIEINTKGLSKELGIPVITCSARKNIDNVKEAIEHIENLEDKALLLPKKEELCEKYITYNQEPVTKTEKRLDKLLCGKYTAVPVMVLFLALILWITISGANYPSLFLAKLLTTFGEKLGELLLSLSVPYRLYGILIDGAQRGTLRRS